jgi:hypothetical protein
MISIGVLSIGLVSVAALIPAGKSQAGRAIVLDRAGIMAANALADAVNFGLLRPAALTASGTFVVDLGTGLSGITSGTLRSQGIYSTASTASAPASFHRLFMQGRDDIVLTPPVTDDDLPTNLFIDGARAFEGRLTCMYVLTTDTPSRLATVVFHNRDPSATVLTGTMTSGRITTASLAGLGDRTAKELMKPGAVLYAANGLHQILAAAFDATGDSAFLTLSTGPAITTSGTITFQLLPDSVGLAETTYRPETSGPYLE